MQGHLERSFTVEPGASTLLVDSEAMADFFRGQLPTSKGASGESNADTYIDIGIGIDIGMTYVKEEEARGQETRGYDCILIEG